MKYKPIVIPIPHADFKSPSDFTATYLSGTTLTIGGLPPALTIIDASQIVYVKQVCTGREGATYENASGACYFSYAGTTLTIHGCGNEPFVPGDVFEIGVNGQSILSAIAENSGSIPVATHRSPVDFTAAFTSNITITLVGLPFAIVDNSQLVYIKQITAANTSKTWINAKNCTLTEAGGVITIHGAGTPFVAADDYEVGINSQDKAYDATQSADKIIEQAPIWDHFTGTVNLVNGTDIGVADGVWLDQGSEIDCRGFTKLSIWVVFTVEDSLGNQIQVLSKHTSGGTGEYPLEVAASYQKTLGNADMIMKYDYYVDNDTPYIQIQTVAADVIAPAGTDEGTIVIDIIKCFVGGK